MLSLCFRQTLLSLKSMQFSSKYEEGENRFSLQIPWRNLMWLACTIVAWTGSLWMINTVVIRLCSVTTSWKWWKYLLWFFLNLSMVNAFILEKITGKKKQSQLDFRWELAKLLIAGYNVYKCASNSGKRAVATVKTEENLHGHFLGKLEGRKMLVPCVRKLEGSAMKAAPLKLHTHVNSAVFLCVSKCAVNSPVFPNSMGKIY